jgi:Zn-dependent protease with chaperone function
MPTAVPAAAPSLRARAALAVALTVAFYVLSLTIAVGLIATPVAVFASSGRGNVWVAAAMIGAGVAILRGIVPERGRFSPPGPALTAHDHPRLHALLDEVARDAGQRPADDVFLDIDVNAAVLEHRGRRVLLLGLPLLAVLGRDELRAVVAHELGHYAGGDTRFSGWIWRTRVAVLKTVEHLATSGSWFRRTIVRHPFELYARLFLRLTNAVSRRQELAADALSARVTSPDAAGRALRRIAAVAPTYDGFWQQDVVPMLEAARRPPLASGFVALTRHAELAATLDAVLEADLGAREPDRYASHPTLGQRLRALGVAADPHAPDPEPVSALSLLTDVPALERDLLAQRFGEQLAGFEPADWEAAGAVHLADRRCLVTRFAGVLDAGATLRDAGVLARDLAAWRPRVRERLEALERDARGAAPDEVDRFTLDLLVAHVVVAAADAGAVVSALPGEPLRIHHAGARLDAWESLAERAAFDDGSEPRTSWTAHPVVQALGAAPLVPGARAAAA